MIMRPLSALRKRLKRYGLSRNLASVRWQADFPLTTPLDHRLRALRGGFTSASYGLYDLGRNDPADYLPDLAAGSDAARRSNGPFAVSLFSDKLLAHMLMREHLPLPKLLALIQGGRVFPVAGGTVGDVGALLAYLQGEGDVILKPSSGMRGGGVISLSCDGGFKIDGQSASEEAVRALVASLDDYLVEAYVQGAAYARAIFPDAANTLRVVTMRDVERGHAPFVAAAIHKFGTRETAPTDNWSRGGLSACVDLQTGALGPAARGPTAAGGKPRWTSTHPDTGAPIEGVRVPDWPLVQKALLDAASSLGFLTYVGWDVLVTEAGPCLIEGNTTVVGLRGVQVHAPLLRDPRVRRFFEFYGALEPATTKGR